MSLATTGIVPILLPLEVLKIEGQATHIGVVTAAIGAGLLTAPPWGRLADSRRWYRALIVAGSLMAAAALAGFGFAQRLHEWFFLAFLMGAGCAGIFTVSNLLVIELYPPDERDSAIGWLQAYTTFGTVFGLVGPAR